MTLPINAFSVAWNLSGYIVLVGLGWYLPTTEKLVITTQHMDLGQAAILLYVWTQA